MLMVIKWLIVSFIFFIGFSWCTCAAFIYHGTSKNRYAVTKFLQLLSLVISILCAFYYWHNTPFQNAIWGLAIFHMLLLSIIVLPGLKDFLTGGPEALKTQPFAGLAIFLTVVFFWILLYLYLDSQNR